MARLKRASSAFDKGFKRSAALKSIDPNLDLGNGLTVAAYDTAIDKLKKSIDDYNTALSTVDDLLNGIEANEAMVDDLSERMLAGVLTRYGKDSSAYEMAGGVKKSDIKMPSRKKGDQPAK